MAGRDPEDTDSAPPASAEPGEGARTEAEAEGAPEVAAAGCRAGALEAGDVDDRSLGWLAPCPASATCTPAEEGAGTLKRRDEGWGGGGGGGGGGQGISAEEGHKVCF